MCIGEMWSGLLFVGLFLVILNTLSKIWYLVEFATWCEIACEIQSKFTDMVQICM